MTIQQIQQTGSIDVASIMSLMITMMVITLPIKMMGSVMPKTTKPKTTPSRAKKAAPTSVREEPHITGYRAPLNVSEALSSSMGEEHTAADWYRQRAEYARTEGDEISARLWDHIAEEEGGHYNEFKDRRAALRASRPRLLAPGRGE